MKWLWMIRATAKTSTHSARETNRKWCKQSKCNCNKKTEIDWNQQNKISITEQANKPTKNKQHRDKNVDIYRVTKINCTLICHYVTDIDDNVYRKMATNDWKVFSSFFVFFSVSFTDNRHVHFAIRTYMWYANSYGKRIPWNTMAKNRENLHFSCIQRSTQKKSYHWKLWRIEQEQVEE